MQKKSRSMPFATIRIGVPESAKFREIKLSRFQFEITLIALPTAIIWGLISTVILFQNKKFISNDKPVTNERLEAKSTANSIGSETLDKTIATKELADNSLPSLTTKSLEKYPVPTIRETTEKSKTTPTVKNRWGKSTFKINERFAVSTSVIGDTSKGPFSLKLATKNLSDKLETGFLWVSIRGVTKTGADVWFTATENMKIDWDGHTDSPDDGIHYSFRHYKEQILPLYGPSVEIRKFDELIIGFADAQGKQLIGKINL